MSAPSATESPRSSGRARWKRWRRVILGMAVALVAVGAFLIWGPVGLGAGPLFMGAYNSGGGPDQALTPLGVVLHVYNSGHDPAVIDSVRLIGRTSYPAPHVIALEVLSSGLCGAAFPVRLAGKGFVLVDCGGRYVGPLIGHAFGFTPPKSPGYAAVAVVSPPEAVGCWVLTDVVVHYHVGIRHYATTDPEDISICSGKHVDAEITAAMQAAENAEPR